MTGMIYSNRVWDVVESAVHSALMSQSVFCVFAGFPTSSLLYGETRVLLPRCAHGVMLARVVSSASLVLAVS